MKINKRALIFVSLFTLAVFIISLFTNRYPKVVNSSPQNGSITQSINSPIIIYFNRDIVLNKLNITVSPTEEFNLDLIDNKTLSITPQKPLRYETPYFLQISYQNKQITTINFKTSTPPGTQFDARLIDDIVTERNNQYPLLLITPHETPNYKAYYIAPLTIEVKIKIKDLFESEIIAEVKSWVTQNGGDVASHKFVVATP